MRRSTVALALNCADATADGDAASISDAAGTGDSSDAGDSSAADASCETLGCAPTGTGGSCGATKVQWVCGGTRDDQAFLAGGCTDPATNVQRFCCPATSMSACHE